MKGIRHLKQLLSIFRNGLSFFLFRLTKNERFYNRSFTFLASLNKDQIKLWDSASGIYNQRYSQKPPDSFFLKYVIEQSNRNNQILEFGCSTGMNLRYLKNLGYNYLQGIDISNKSIQIAKKNEHEILYKTQDLLLSNLNLKYDIIFVRAVLQHIEAEKLKIILLKLITALNANGKLIFKEAYDINLPFGRINRHRVYETFNHNYFDILKRYELKLESGLFVITLN